jgi:PAS domain S-box-containing protein
MRRTARHEAAQSRALRESEERTRRALEGSSDGFFDWDLGAGTAALSPSFESLLGRAPGTLPAGAEDLKALLHPDDADRARAALRAHLRRGVPCDVELRLRLPDGGWRWVRARAQASRAAGAGGLRLAGSISDISQRKAAEHELQEAHARLEQRVQERTRELTAANRRLLEVDRLKDEFLATVSHELRTPLNSILGFTTILLDGRAGPLTEEQRRQLGFVHASGEHLLQLINDVLDLSRIESGHMAVAAAPFDFCAVAVEIEAQLRPLVLRKGLAWRSELPPALPMVGDRRKVYQVLLNLAGNAIKFTESGEVRVEARARRGRLEVSVHDTGIGIAAQHLGTLFQAFRQVDGALRRSHEGTGLGLYLCRRLLDLMDGRIEVSSTPGAGSCFRFVLPLRRPAAAGAAPAPDRPAPLHAG